MSNVIRVVVSAAVLLCAASSGSMQSSQSSSSPQGTPRVEQGGGRSATLLPDGSVLLLGGDANPAAAAIYDPVTRTTREAGRLRTPRAWHTATVLPDGTVLVAGGVGPDGQLVADAERFEPVRGTFSDLSDTVFTPRAHHTATLLTDGRVLFAGGRTPGDAGLRAEIWDPVANSSAVVGGAEQLDRVDATAKLLPDGRVRVSGGGTNQADVIVDPDLEALSTLVEGSVSSPSSGVATVRPADGATNVPVASRIAVRFAEPIDAGSAVAVLERVDGVVSTQVPARVVTAEGGVLLFVNPSAEMDAGGV